jgi:hypothetical protein
VEQGRRLENLSWRLWNRETFCCQTQGKVAPSTTTPPRDIPVETRIPDVPQLSASVDSEVDEEAVDDFTSVSAPVDISRPRIRRQDSCASSRSRGRERHITSDNFERMVVSIITQDQPLTAPLPEIASPNLKAETSESSLETERTGSTTDESPSKESFDESPDSSQQPSSPELFSKTTVVRGFSPSHLTVPRVVSEPPKPSPATVTVPRPVQTKKQQATFALGGSYSSSEQGQSLETRKPMLLQPKKKIFQVGGSSEEESSLKSALHSPRPNSLLTVQKKQTSFSDQVTTRTIANDNAIDDSETEADYMDESAIDDDDDSSEWEDSIEDSGKSSIDEKTFFQRVDSKVNLTTRRSLITLMLEQNDRSRKLGNAASQSTSAIPRSRTAPLGQTLAASPNDSDDNHLMMKGVRPSPLRPIREIPRSAAQPILVTANHTQQQAALSPRTTRRNMLATELTASLRRHLLWERQQKSSTANAVLKRRHTSHDVANLRQYPERPYMTKSEDPNPSSWNQILSGDAFNGYHSKGW